MRTCVILTCLVATAACHQPVTAPPPPPAPIVAATADSSELLARRRDSLANLEQRRMAEARAEAELALRDTLSMRIGFAFDRADIAPADLVLLQRKAAILRRNPAVALRVEGNCDERGSDEYNLALGQRRAVAVRTFLAGYGVDAERVTVVSYGEERPLSTVQDEAGWARNRRDDFTLLGGGSAALKVP